MRKKKTALLSVSDKTGIVEFAHELVKLDFEIFAFGGTAKILKQSELEIRVFNELVSGPLIEAVTVDRADGKAVHALEELDLPPIDLVAVNFYPVSEILQQKSVTPKEFIDFVDISANLVLRAAAKNYHHVIALCDPQDYERTLEELTELKELPLDARQSLAAKAYHYCAYYDSTIAQYLSPRKERLPDEMVIGLKKAVELKYGENPHQEAALYRLSGARPWGLAAATLLHGKALNYSHYLSLEIAAELVGEFRDPACVIVKHMNPAGAAVTMRLGDAAKQAYLSDPAGCTGGVAAFNREVDEEAARVLSPQYLECVVASQFSPDALDILRAKKDIRLVSLPSLLLSANEIDLRPVSGGLLIQDKDNQTLPHEPKIVTRRAPTDVEMTSMDFAWKVAKHAKSHAAVLAQGTTLLGIGSGQTSRMDAIRLASVKGEDRHPIVAPGLPVVLASDTALSLRHILEAADHGVSAVIQPGGTAEDQDTIRACDSKRMAMVFTGIRHQRH